MSLFIIQDNIIQNKRKTLIIYEDPTGKKKNSVKKNRKGFTVHEEPTKIMFSVKFILRLEKSMTMCNTQNKWGKK